MTNEDLELLAHIAIAGVMAWLVTLCSCLLADLARDEAQLASMQRENNFLRAIIVSDVETQIKRAVSDTE